jgi:hypothetical protein
MIRRHVIENEGKMSLANNIKSHVIGRNTLNISRCKNYRYFFYEHDSNNIGYPYVLTKIFSNLAVPLYHVR